MVNQIFNMRSDLLMFFVFIAIIAIVIICEIRKLRKKDVETVRTPYRIGSNVYLSEGIERMFRDSEYAKEIMNVLNRFQAGNIESSEGKPENALIKSFGSYETYFGTLWVINYSIFSDRDFITVLLPYEYDK